MRHVSKVVIRKPSLRDAESIAGLIRHYAERRFMLARSVEQVCEDLRDFVVAEDDGVIVGCGALHLWSDLAEIRSLGVVESHWRRGIGSDLVRRCLAEAVELGVREVFTLTYQPDFFERLGFKRVSKARFPQKIWVDCANCPQFPNCGEVALIRQVTPPA